MQGVLCFTIADLPLVRRRCAGISCSAAERLLKRLKAEGSLPPTVVEAVAGALAAVLPRA